MFNARMPVRTKSGFTIVELLIVIVVIAILASITIVAFNGIQQRAGAVAARATQAQLARSVMLFNSDNGVYPTSISDCPTPASGNLCLPAKTGQTINYFSFSGSVPARYSAALHTSQPAYEIQVFDTGGFYYYSTAEISHVNEFVQYMDMAPIINKYGLRPYKISFDIRSESIASASSVMVYMQNGSESRYTFGASVPVTTTYQRQTITVTPAGPNSGVTQSLLAFYGTYGTGNRPTIKNLEITF